MDACTNSYIHTRTHTHTRTHARARAHTHTQRVMKRGSVSSRHIQQQGQSRKARPVFRPFPVGIRVWLRETTAGHGAARGAACAGFDIVPREERWVWSEDGVACRLQPRPLNCFRTIRAVLSHQLFSLPTSYTCMQSNVLEKLVCLACMMHTRTSSSLW